VATNQNLAVNSRPMCRRAALWAYALNVDRVQPCVSSLAVTEYTRSAGRRHGRMDRRRNLSTPGMDRQ
jgi:hypothetical protein